MLLIKIGNTLLYSGALNSTYDASANSALDATTNEDLDAITGNLALACEPLTIEHEVDGRSTAGLTIRDDSGAYTFSERQQILIGDNDWNMEFAGVLQSSEGTKTATSHISDASFGDEVGSRALQDAVVHFVGSKRTKREVPMLCMDKF